MHITKISAQGRSEKNLCKACAAKYGDMLVELGAQPFSLSDFLRGVFNGASKEEEDKLREARWELLSCPRCGMTYKEFTEGGRLGCATCYETFKEPLKPMLRRLHGATTHLGKAPRRTGASLRLRHTIDALKDEQQGAVAAEAYERAAELRDQIRTLEEKLASMQGKEA